MTTDTSATAAVPGTPTLAEDLLLLLFQPDSGVIAGETTLYYVLGAAMLADLALSGSVTATTTRGGSVTVEAVEGCEPSDEIFHATWEYVSGRSRGVQTILPVIGPKLRQPLLSRLITRGDVRKEKRKTLGLFTTTALVDGGSGRRYGLLENLRNVLVDHTEPTPRGAALAALVWGSGTLPQFDPVIPWDASVIARAKAFERGNWGAAAAGEAVTRTMTAIIVNSVIVAAAVRPPQ